MFPWRRKQSSKKWRSCWGSRYFSFLCNCWDYDLVRMYKANSAKSSGEVASHRHPELMASSSGDIDMKFTQECLKAWILARNCPHQSRYIIWNPIKTWDILNPSRISSHAPPKKEKKQLETCGPSWGSPSWYALTWGSRPLQLFFVVDIHGVRWVNFFQVSS